MTTQSGRINVNVVLLKEEFGWTVQGLDYDIVAQGKNPKVALQAFDHILKGQIILDLEAGRDPLSLIPRAPDSAWNLDEIEGIMSPKEEPVMIPSAPWMRASRNVLAFA